MMMVMAMIVGVGVGMCMICIRTYALNMVVMTLLG